MFQDTSPLAERMRPAKLTDLFGQDHLVGENGVLKRAIQSGQIPSMILWGPPGTGKTTIANIIANEGGFNVMSPCTNSLSVEPDVPNFCLLELDTVDHLPIVTVSPV